MRSTIDGSGRSHHAIPSPIATRVENAVTVGQIHPRATHGRLGT